MVRIVTNYIRLLLTLALGLILIPVLLRLVGDEATGMISLLGASVGLAALAQEIARDSMIRELGKAHHTGGSIEFRNTYNSSIVLCFAGALLTMGIFGMFYLLLPVLSIPQELLEAVEIFLIAKALQSFFEIFLSPQFNMFLVYERMAQLNVYYVLHRSMLLGAAGIVYLLSDLQTVSERLAAFGIISATLQTVCLFAAVAILVFQNKDLRPSIRYFSWIASKEIAGTSGWNLLMSVSIRLHERIGSVLMNIYFGPIGNLLFDSLAFRLSSYVRMFASGMTTGVDAIATRISSANDSDHQLKNFLVRSTQYHAIATFPAAAIMFIMADPLISLWIGGHVKDPETVVPTATMILRVLMIGMVVRCVGDGWLRIFYGAGLVSKYSPIVFLGGLISPLFTAGLYYMLPEDQKVLSVALSFSILLLLFNGVIAPYYCCRLLKLHILEICAPLIRPMVISLVAGSALLAARFWHKDWSLEWIIVAFATFALSYVVLTLVWVVPRDDLKRLKILVLRKG